MLAIRLMLVNIIIHFMAARWKTVNAVIQTHKKKPEDPDTKNHVVTLLDWFGVRVDLSWSKPHWTVSILIVDHVIAKAQLNNGAWGFNRTTVKALIDTYKCSIQEDRPITFMIEFPSGFLDFSLMDRITGKVGNRFIMFPDQAYAILITTVLEMSKSVRGLYSHRGIRSSWDVQEISGPLNLYLWEDLISGTTPAAEKVIETNLQAALDRTMAAAYNNTIIHLNEAVESELRELL